jgi:predicted dehydrogenase
MEQVKVGAIGCGYWGPNLIRNFVEIPSSEVVAIADLSVKRLDHMKSRYPKVKVTEDYRTLFSMGLDAVVVATPPATHFQIAKDCLEHDLCVLVEKPMTLNSREAEELIEIAEQRGLTLMVGHTFEYNSAIQMLKEIIQSGELGEIYYIDAVRVNLGLFQPSLNVIWDLAPHDISILLYLLNRDPMSVSAQGMDCLFEGVHDIAYLHLIFPGRVLANVHLSWLDPCKVRRLTIVGSRKMVVFDDIEPMEKIKIYDKGVEFPPYTNTFNEFQLSYRYGDVVIPHIKFTEPLRVECSHFIESIQNQTEPRSSGVAGLKVVRVVEAANRSLKNGGKQELALPEEIKVHEQSVT